MNVFISYNKLDKNIVKEVAIFLSAENISVWFDEWEILAGDSLTEGINNGLKWCTHFVIVWSKNTAKSNWVNRELSSTLSKTIIKKSPKIIPIVLDNTKLPDLLVDIKYIRYDNGSEKDRNELVKSITGENPSQDFIKAIVRKYHEVIFDYELGDPFGLRACPECGSQNLEGNSFTDYNRDENYYFLKCKDCEWSDWTQ